MTVAWPIAGSFPQDLLLGDTMTVNDNAVRTEMDSGPHFMRLKDTVYFRTYTGAILITSAQRATLLSFWETDTKSGTIPFQWHDPATGDALTFRLLSIGPFTDQGNGWLKVDISFEEVPS